MNDLVEIRIERIEDNKVFSLGSKYLDNFDWGITDISGIDNPENQTITNQKAVGDGIFITGTYIEGRTIDISACVKNRSLNDVQRRLAIQFFNKKYSYKLHITYMELQRWIIGILDVFLCPSGKVYKNQTMQVSFLCDDPYFKSEEDYGVNIATLRPMLGFPYIQTNMDCPDYAQWRREHPQHPKIMVVGAVYNFARDVYIRNDGDVDTFMQVVLRFHGEVTNPKIAKYTPNGDLVDEIYVRLLGVFHRHDIATIDMVNRRVSLNGENAMHLIDRTSYFLSCNLSPGYNRIGFGAEDGIDYMDVVVFYNSRYMGI